MVLPPDSRLGPYQIGSLLGAGAMGEVYRARDTRLHRDVAVKVLPAASSADPDRMRRFEQEARAAAALDHPNILAVHDVGSHDGSPYIVSELLAGKTLREVMAGRALPQRRAVDYAVQIARGLAAAHAKGIVHRDLKPENVFVTSDAHVKILDFGLAKLSERGPGPVAAGSTAATHMAGTEPGMVMGTVAYMSPEQVRGQAVDARSDIFALGAMLYEMLSGRRAFAGETPADTMSAVLSREPPDLQATVTERISPGVDRIVRHCLEKSPDQRFQSARDLAFDLESLSQPSEPATATAQRERPRFRWLWPAVAIASILTALAAVAWAFVPRSTPQPITYQQLTFRQGDVPCARFASDGHTVVYSGAWEGAPRDVYSVQDGGVESRSLGLKGASLLSVSTSGELAVSLDARFLGGFSFAGTLAQVPLAGAGPRQILRDVEDADWAPDGMSLAIVREEEGRSRLEYPMGRVLYSTAGWLSHPRVSPDGQSVAFIDHPFRHDDAGSVALSDRSGHVRRLMSALQTAQGLAWHGAEVWVTAALEGNSRSIYAIGLDGRSRLVASGPGLLTLLDIAPDGRALLTQNNERLGIMAHVPGTDSQRDLSWLDWSRLRGITDDGTMVLFDETGEGGGKHEGVYVRSVDGSPAVRLSDGTAEDMSGDGKWVIATSVDRKEVVIVPTGPGQARHLSVSGIAAIQRALWFPDLSHVLVVGNQEGRAARLYVVAADGGAPRPISAEGASASVSISPDGRNVAASLADGRVLVYPADGGAPRPVPAVLATEQIARWSPDGAGLYVYDPSKAPIVITRVDVTTGRRESVKQIDTPGGSPIYGWLLSVTPDLKSYAYATRIEASILYLVQGLK